MTLSLQTPRLTLRPFTLEDVPQYQNLLDQGELWRGQRLTTPSAERLIPALMLEWEARGFGLLGVFKGAELVGQVGLGISIIKRKTWISMEYAVVSDQRRQGIASEAGRACLDFGFSQRGLGRIIAIAEAHNHASIRVMQKIGMQPFDLALPFAGVVYQSR